MIGFIAEFFDDNYGFVKPFEKYSALHQFIGYIIGRFLDDDMNTHDERAFKLFQEHGQFPKLYADFLSEEYGSGYTFEDFNDGQPLTYESIEKYHDELVLTGEMEEICEQIAEEVFYILFNNRDLLLRFNHLVAGYVSEIDLDFLNEDEDLAEYAQYFKKDGQLIRASIPEWCKKAVFFREKGRCSLCGTDLSGLLNTNHKPHYDHIVPLSQGGINDVSNIQLLCAACNLKKWKKDIVTSSYYFKWY